MSCLVTSAVEPITLLDGNFRWTRYVKNLKFFIEFESNQYCSVMHTILATKAISKILNIRIYLNNKLKVSDKHLQFV